jgi:hypothetical protein
VKSDVLHDLIDKLVVDFDNALSKYYYHELPMDIKDHNQGEKNER